MRCEEARAALLEGEVSPAVLEHLETCPHCRAVRRPLEAMDAGLRDPLLWVEPAPALEGVVVDVITSGSGAPRSGRRRGLVAALAGAAAVTIALVGAGGLWLVLHSPGPDWEVTLEGSHWGAANVATVSGWRTASGTRVVIAGDGLDEAPPGFAYELWFSRGGTHVSAGTFTTLDEPVEMTVGVARRDYPRLWVTLEPIDADPSPSSSVVLDVSE